MSNEELIAEIRKLKEEMFAANNEKELVAQMLVEAGPK
jgi:hypothetical protein